PVSLYSISNVSYNHPTTTKIHTPSLHDALPIYLPTVPIIISEWTNLNPNNINRMLHYANDWAAIKKNATQSYAEAIREGHFKTKDRKSTRLNSSHVKISYAVFCLKKKKNIEI